jgi:hypothetical protein
MDVIFIAALGGFTALCCALVALCARLGEAK